MGRVLVLYVAGSFAVIEAADTLLEAFSQPEWMLRGLFVLAILGLPLALGLSWAFDIDPDHGSTPVDASELHGGELAPPSAPPAHWFSTASVLVAVGLVLFGTAAGAILGPLIGGRAVADRSIAVLPLQNLSPDPDNQYFADGIHEDVITQLSKISGLKVISRTSVLGYRGADRHIPTIAAELGVAAVLEGSVRRDKDRVRITVQLIDGATDEHLWAETYDRTLEDVFAVQGELARAIARELEAVLLPSEETSLSSGAPTEIFEAYEQFLRGSEALTRTVSQLDPRLLAKSVEALERAVRLDPRFAVAWAYLSVALEWSQRLASEAGERIALQRRVEDAAERAWLLNPDLPESLYAKAFQGSRAPNARERAAADIALLERALTLKPSGAEILRELALRYELLGEIEEAARYANRAVGLEPRSAVSQLRAAIYSRLRRDFEEASHRVRLAASLASDAPLAAAAIVSERLTLELARGGGVARARNILREQLPLLDRSAVVSILSEFPELLTTNGEFADLALSPTPTVDDPDLRCTCYELRAWAQDIAGNSESAKALWDSLSMMGETATAIHRGEMPNTDRDRFRQAAILARAGHETAARVLFEEELPPGSEARHDTRFARAVAHAALGDADSAVAELRYLLSVPSEVTTATLRDRLIWAPIRDHPSFQALLGG